MELYNKGKRTFVTVAGQIMPGEFIEVKKEIGQQLQALYPDELVVPTKTAAVDDTVDVLKADLEATKAERDEAKARIEQLEKAFAEEKEAAEKAIAAARAEVAKLQKDIEKHQKA